MTRPRRLTRRAVLAAGAAGAGVLAGCNRTTGSACPVDASQNPGTAAWPTPTGDVHNTRSVPQGDVPEPPLSVEWTTVVGGHVGVPCPTVVDGTVYTSDMDTTVEALDAGTGETVWSVEGQNRSAPVVADDAVVTVNSRRTRVRTVDRDGTRRWTAPLPAGVPFLANRVAAVADGTALVATDTGLVAVDLATGERRWRYAVGLTVGRHPAVVDGTVYAGGGDAYLHALDLASGDREWWAKTPAAVEAPPSVVGDTVYAATVDGTVLALSTATGEERWRADVDASVERLAVDGGHVYAGADSGLYALRADSGERCWRYRPFDPSYAGGMAASTDRVFATVGGSTGGTVAALDPRTGREEWRASVGDRLTSGPAVVDGAVYAGGAVERELAVVKLA